MIVCAWLTGARSRRTSLENFSSSLCESRFLDLNRSDNAASKRKVNVVGEELEIPKEVGEELVAAFSSSEKQNDASPEPAAWWAIMVVREREENTWDYYVTTEALNAQSRHFRPASTRSVKLSIWLRTGTDKGSDPALQLHLLLELFECTYVAHPFRLLRLRSCNRVDRAALSLEETHPKSALSPRSQGATTHREHPRCTSWS